MIAAAVAFASAGTAGAATVNLSAPGTDALSPRVVVDSHGDAFAIWEDGGGANIRIQAAVRPAGGEWQAPIAISPAGENASHPRLAVDPQGEAVAVWVGADELIQASIRPPGGEWGSALALSAAGEASEPAVAISAEGESTVVWWRFNGTDPTIQASTHPSGGAWQTPQNLSPGTAEAEQPEVATDPAGNAVAVWEEATKVLKSSVHEIGHPIWHPSIEVAPAPGVPLFSPQLAVDQSGNAVAVWTVERSVGRDAVEAAVLPFKGSWATAAPLSPEGADASNPRVVFDARGNATVVWVRSDSSGLRIESVTRTATGVLDPVLDISTAGGKVTEPDVAVNARGDAIAVWDRVSTGSEVIQSAARLSGLEWEVPLNLTAPGGEARDPEIALAEDDTALSVWRHTSADETPSIQATSFLAGGPLLGAVSIPASGIAGEALSFSVSPLDELAALGATSWSFGDGAAASGTGVSHTFAIAGVYAVAVTGTDVLGNPVSASGTVVVAPAPAPGVRPPTSPVLNGLRQSARTWREGKLSARISARRKPPIGTTFSFTLNETASVTFRFTQAVSGRSVAGKCVVQSRSNRRRRRCARTITAGALTLAAHAASDKLRFQGLLTKHKQLKPGSYTVSVTATSSTERSASESLRFTIVR